MILHWDLTFLPSFMLLSFHSVVTPPEPEPKKSIILSVEHVILFVTTWLQIALGVKQLRHTGITKSDIESKCLEPIEVLKSGQEEACLQFKTTRPRKAKARLVVVIISLASILILQKHPIKNPLISTTCESMIRATMQRQSQVSVSSQTILATRIHYQRMCSLVDSNEHLFVLPFKSSQSNLLSADSYSTELSARLAAVDQSRSDLRNYFENSLHDTLINRQHIMNGMDLNTLNPKCCLNDSIINFFLKWLITPRTPTDKSSSAYAFSTYFLSKVLTEGYTPTLQRWLAKVNVFEKKLLLVPVHFAHHWSLVAIFNPGKIKQTQRRWLDQNYTGEVTAMMHFDSLGPNTIHDRKAIANAVRLVLNIEWDKRYNNTLDQFSRPFTHRGSCDLICPKGK